MNEQGDRHYVNMIEDLGALKWDKKSMKMCQKTCSKRRKNGHLRKWNLATYQTIS